MDVGRNCGEVDLDLFIIAFTIASEVVTHVLNRAGSVLQVSVEHKVRVASNLTICAEHESRSVQVKIKTAIILVGVPTQTNDNLAKSGVALGKTYFLSLGKIDCHLFFLLNHF